MIYKFSCEHCGQRVSADRLEAGREVNCPSCAGAFLAPSAPNLVRIYGAAMAIAAVILLVGFSWWTEWGPLNWIARIFSGEGRYNLSTFLGGAIVGLSVMLLLPFLRVDGRLDRGATFLAFGVPALCLMLVFGLGVRTLLRDLDEEPLASFHAAIDEAGFLPRIYRIDRATLSSADPGESLLANLDLDAALQISETSTRRGGDAFTWVEGTYIPVAKALWPANGTPVFFRLHETREEFQVKELTSTSVAMHKAPIHPLVRRQKPEWNSIFAVVIETDSFAKVDVMGLVVGVGLSLVIGGAMLVKNLRK